MRKSFLLIGFLYGVLSSSTLFAQGGDGGSTIPPIEQMRAEESYDFLNENDSAKLFLKSLKWIPISQKNGINLSLGGQYRPRFEYFHNVGYTPENQFYYSQRISLHANLTWGKHFRVFGELYHGATSNGQIFLESDRVDWQQGFIEFKFPLTESNSLSFRFGRQELNLGGSRFIGLREGPNIRQSFDLLKLKLQLQNLDILAFYGTYVNPNFLAFDNTFDLFNPQRANPTVWSLGGRMPLKKSSDKNLEVYYVGFQSKEVQMSDVFGDESRQSIGVRSFGSVGKRWAYNTELIYQFGNLAGNTISAFNFETDWKYALKTQVKTLLGLKLDISSGDRELGDGKIQTFNPLFVNPAIYSLAGLNTPTNLTSLHPNVTFIFKKMSVFIDYAFFFRTSANDGLYTPPRFLVREAEGITAKKIGDTFGLQFSYQINRNISIDLRTTYFISGDFIKASGPSENIFYLAPTMNFRF